jgi:membrane protease YdiL (CAAX protease family)
LTGGEPEASGTTPPPAPPPGDGLARPDAESPAGGPSPLAPEVPAPSVRAPGLFRFSLEGRRAPALFVGGWLGTVLGAALALVGLLGGAGTGPAVLLLVGLAILSVGLVLLGGSQAIERRAANEPYAGPSPILLFVAIIAVTLVVAGVVGTVLSLAGVQLPDSERPLGDLISVVIQALVFLGMVRLMVVGTGAISWSDMGLTLPVPRIPAMLLLGAALALPVIFITGLVAGAIVHFIPEVPASPLPPTGTTSGLVLHLLAGAVVAPIAEETVFRGAMLTAWARGAGVTAAIVRSAVLFALAHALTISGATFTEAAGLAVVATVARIPVALTLGWIYARTGTLWASIGLHASFNAILIVLSEVGLAAPTAYLLLGR